jgi:DNA-binding GntR family transcriptional regulator
VAKAKLPDLRTIVCPARHIFALLREPRKRQRYDDPRQLPSFQDLAADEASRFAQELIDLGLVVRDHGRLTIVDWTVGRIVEHLALAGAIQALAASEVATLQGKADFACLEDINAALKSYETRADNLLQGAFLDYHWHLELVRLSGNRTAFVTYAKAIPPAVWIAGANYFQLDEARSSLIEHDRLIAYMKAGDTLRARDAVSFHIEEAAAQIRRAGAARIESYPRDRLALAQF